MKVVIVEDELPLRALYALEICSAFPEASVFEFQNGREALSYFKNNLADIIITDGRMPDMTGFDLAQELRKQNVEAPIILVSGFINDFEKFSKSGLFSHMFEKPVDFDELNSALSSLL